MSLSADPIHRAAVAIRDASAILITAGAGMGVDSGLPDFRGPEGFWNAYPPYRKLGLRFEQMANPMHFVQDPHLAWGFYGHRLSLYRNTKPHPAFSTLLNWAKFKQAGFFVFTSNVDGQFATAGFPFDRVVECHGSIHHIQCTQSCCGEVWSADGIEVKVDLETMRAADPLPRCPYCGGMARPNILMFGDGQWVSSRTDRIDAEFDKWQSQLKPTQLCVIECGAGTNIPTVRLESERLARKHQGKLIRINPRESAVTASNIAIPLAAAKAIQEIASVLESA